MQEILSAFRETAVKNGAGQRMTNACERADGANGALRDDAFDRASVGPDAALTSPVLAFNSFSISSNKALLGLSWRTNFAPSRAWLELYEKSHSLTNPWVPRLVRNVPTAATNDAFAIALTNGSLSSAFYSARIDTLHLDFPGLVLTEGADGERVYSSFGSLSFPVTVERPGRPDGFPPPDPAFSADPFAYVDGVTFDPSSSTLTVSDYGVYELPDGSFLAAFDQPRASFGSPHGFVGTTVRLESGSYMKSSPYPLSTPSLQAGWSRGTTPGTGCSCVPTVDFGGGLIVRDSSGAARQTDGQGLPAGMWTDFDYGDGGVWVTLYNHTNVVWREWCAHRWYGDNGGTSDELGGSQEEDECACGDQDSLEGSSVGSVRFRIPLGSACTGEVSGFLYFNRDCPFDVTPSAFELLTRSDAFVTDDCGGDGTRTVSCHVNRGGRLFCARTIRETASTSPCATRNRRESSTHDP